MTRVRLAPGVLEDLDRIVEHLRRDESAAAESRAGEIISAFDVLADYPMIGHPTSDDERELLIGRGPAGYVALYRYLPVIDTALILVVVRGQREAGYARP